MSSPKHQRIDFARVNGAALKQIRTLLPKWFPAGRLYGREFKVGDLQGSPGQSLSINVDSGVWMDFATGEAGGDPVSLKAAITGCQQSQAARLLMQEVGL